MPFFHSDTILFHYLDLGKGVPFVFQHGMGGDVHQIQDLFEPPIPFRLLTLDCRGHGETRPVGDPTHLGFASFADDLLAMIDMLHLQQIAVGGISMGAAVALNFALRYPQRVLGLVLVRPAWLNEPLPVNLRVYPRIAALIRHYGAVQGLEHFKLTEEYLEVQCTSPMTADSLRRQFTRPQAEEAVDILECLPQDAPNREQEDWTRIPVPTLILANEYDPLHPFGYGEVLAHSIPGAILEKVTPKAVDAHQHARDIQRAIERFFGRAL